MQVLTAAVVVVGAVTAWVTAPPPAPDVEECVANHGISGAVVNPDGSIEIPTLTNADNNAGQAWDAKADQAYDQCTENQ